jgi:membrane associated rhomboid family serine protease
VKALLKLPLYRSSGDKPLGIVHWTPFCTTVGLLNLVVFGLQYSNIWNWHPWAFPSDNPQWHQAFTSLILHGSWQHLTNNAFCLFAFGTALEQKIGSSKTALIYLISGLGGNLLYMFMESNSGAIGASGCLFGILCSLIFMDPKALVLCPGAPIPVPIILYAPLYVANEIFAYGDNDSIAHAAHIGGGIAGALAGRILAGNPAKANI